MGDLENDRPKLDGKNCRAWKWRTWKMTGYLWNLSIMKTPLLFILYNRKHGPTSPLHIVRTNPTDSVMVKLEFCNGDVCSSTSPTTKSPLQSLYKLCSFLHKFILCPMLYIALDRQPEDILSQAKEHRCSQESLAVNIGPAATGLNQQGHTELHKNTPSFCERWERAFRKTV